MTAFIKFALAAICCPPVAFLALAVICAAIRSSQISADERRRQFHEAFVERNQGRR
jgi:hypothetical protein